MDRQATLEKLQPGTQILYVPNHANGNLDHPAVEAGFVTSVQPNTGIVFCRYFTTTHPQSTLRTRANSEGTALFNIVIKDTRPQSGVDSKLKRILEEQGP